MADSTLLKLKSSSQLQPPPKPVKENQRYTAIAQQKKLVIKDLPPPPMQRLEIRKQKEEIITQQYILWKALQLLKLIKKSQLVPT